MTLFAHDQLRPAMAAGGEPEARRLDGDLPGRAEAEKPAAPAPRGGVRFGGPGA